MAMKRKADTSQSLLGKDTKTFLKGGVSDLISGIDLPIAALIPKKSEDFVQKVLKDTKGNLVVNEPIHNIMHRFLRIAKKKGFNKIMCLGLYGHGKTEQLCIGYSLYRIAKNPNILIKIVHVSDTEATKRCRSIRDYIERDDDFQEIAPHITPTSIWGSERFTVNRESPSANCTVEAYSVLGTGIGGRANLIIFDDPQDLRTAIYEPTTRLKIEDTIRNIWLTRMIPDDDSEVILMMNKWHESLVSGKLLTTKGIKDISEMVKGDFVFTSNGFQKVLKTDKAPYVGNTYKITPKYFSAFVSEYTADHEILTDSGWKYAQELTKDDFLIVPIYKSKCDWEKEIRKTFPSKHEYKTKKVKNKPNVNLEKDSLVEYLDKGKTYKEISEITSISVGSIFNLCKYYGINKQRANDLDASIFDDLDFWRILGYWIAEGSLSYGFSKERNNVVRFTFGSHETKIVDDVEKFFNKYGLHCTVIYDYKLNSGLIKVVSTQLAEWLVANFSKGSGNLRLPEWFYALPEDVFFSFLNGYHLGDGCVSNGYARFSSISETLLHGIQLNLLRFGFVSSLYKYNNKGKKTHDFGFGKVEINCQDAYELRIRERLNPEFAYFKDENLYVKIAKINKNKYKGFVYDITTPTHDFCSGGYLVHNSDVASYVQRNPAWAWMSVAVHESKEYLEFKDSFGRKLKLPLWSKFDRKALDDRHITLGDRDFKRGYCLIPYTDSDKTFGFFERCCHFGVSPRSIVENESNWIFVGGIDFAGSKRPGTVLSIVAVHRKTGLKVPVEIVTIRKSSDLTGHIVRTFREYGVELYFAENNGVQEAIIDLLKAAIGEEKFKKYNIKIDGFLTGRGKMDMNTGLPSMDKEFEQKEWMFCFNEKPDISDDMENKVWSRMYYEMLNHPFYETSDIAMSLYFCREAVKKVIRGIGSGPNVY